MLFIKMTPTLKEKIRSIAKAKGLSMSTWARMKLLEVIQDNGAG